MNNDKKPQWTAKAVLELLKKDFPEIEVGLTGEDVISTDEMITTQQDVELA